MDDEEEQIKAIWGSEAEEFSAAATVVPFDPPLPLLRGPVPAGPADDPSAGPFVLAFRDAVAWRSAFLATEAKVVQQCEAGARVGCSINASNKCKPPWWKLFFGSTAADFAERAACEELEMASCLAASKESCIQFAKEKCLQPFRDARIASVNLKGNSQFSLWTESNCGQALGARMTVSEANNIQKNLHDVLNLGIGVTNYRGSDLLDNSTLEVVQAT